VAHKGSRNRDAADETTAQTSPACAIDEPGALVNTVLWSLQQAQRLSLYKPLASKIWPQTWFNARRGTIRGLTAAETYVPIWLCIQIGLLFAVDGRASNGPFGWAVVIIGLYRFVDLTTYHLVTLLERGAGALLSFRRSFILWSLNLAELVLLTSLVLWKLEVGTPLGSAFDLVILHGRPVGTGPWLAMTDVLAIASALLISAELFGLILGTAIGGQFRELRPDERSAFEHNQG
jgi:hypothetical protein